MHIITKQIAKEIDPKQQSPRINGIIIIFTPLPEQAH